MSVSLTYTLFCKKLICKKLELGRPNLQETFGTQATEIKKLFFSFSYHNFEDTVTEVCQKIVYIWTVFSKYFLNQYKYRYSRNQGIVGKLVERQIFLKFQVLV